MVKIFEGANLKRIIVFTTLVMTALCIALAFSPTGTISHAESSAETFVSGTYRVKNNATLDVYTILLNGTEVKLFEIPSTYYFEVTEHTNEIYVIKYNGIDGIYVKNYENFVPLTDTDKEPLGGFTLELVLASDASFYKQTCTSFVETAITPDNSPAITFIGKGEHDGKVCAYVKYGSDFGYIPYANLKTKDGGVAMSDYIIDLHPNYRPNVVTDKNTDKKASDPNKLTRTILIVGIVVPALVIVLLLFKPSKKGRYDYDRNSTMNDYGASPYDRPRSRYRDDYDDGRHRDDYRRDRRRDDDYYDDYDDRRY